MANVGPCSPGDKDSNRTKPVATGNILNSCKTVEELERLTSQYTMISGLLRGLPEESCDKNMAAKLKNELVEIEALLQNLSAATAEAEHLKSDLKEMMADIKNHIWQNIDNYLVNTTLHWSKRGATSGNCVGTPSKNLGLSIDEARSELDSEGKPSACGSRVVFDEGNTENQRPNTDQEGESVSTSVSAEEFGRVSAHLRGRLTVEKVNETLDVLRDVMQLKYRLLKKRKGLTIIEKDAVHRMRSEIVPAVRESRFISEADIQLFKQQRLTKSIMSHLAILRHLQKIREVRDKNVIRIILKC